MKLNDLITFDRMGDFWDILRQVDPEGLVRDAHQSFRIVIVGPSGAGKRALAAALTGADVDRLGTASTVVEVCDLSSDLPVALPNADIYLYLATPEFIPSPAQRDQFRQLSRRTDRLLAIVNRAGQDPGRVEDGREELGHWLSVETDAILSLSPTDHAEVTSVLVPRILKLIPSLVLAVGRRLQPFRDAAADALIAETARVNAEFVLISGLPASFPVLGTIAAAGADLVVLTKNQIMLLLKLAVLYHRPVDNRLQVVSEIAPIVGAAFVWRTAARTLVSLVPSPLAIAPQVAIGYVGTFVVGKSAHYYYRWGRRPSPVALEQFRQEALVHLNGVAPVLARFGRILRLS